jgi:hypothetical protein
VAATDVEANTMAGKIGGIENLRSSIDKVRFGVSGSFAGTNVPTSKQISSQKNLTEDTDLQQQKRIKQTGEDWHLGGSFSYDIATNHFITGSLFSFNTDTHDKSFLDSKMEIAGNESEKYTINTLQSGKDKKTYVSLSYQYDFAKPNAGLNLIYQSQIFHNSISESGSISSEYMEYRYEHTFQAHYFNPLSKTVNFESGLSYVYRDSYQDNQNEDYAYNQSVGSYKNLLTGYINGRYRIKNISLTTNLNAEYLNDGKGNFISKTGAPIQYISESGFLLAPELRFSMYFPQKTISSISATYRIQNWRPGLNMITPYADYSNPDFIVTGNPNLKHQTIHLLSSSATVKEFSVNLASTYSNNAIKPYWYQNEENRLVKSYANYGLDESFSATINYILKKVSFSYFINYRQN